MSDLELLKRYLQNEIDTGSRKIFVFDKDYNVIEFKVIDALNEINNLQIQLQQKENIIKEVREYVEVHKVMTQGHFDGEKWIYQYFELTCDPKELLEILDKENK